MDQAALDYLRRLSEDSPKRFSNWNPSVFVAYSQTVLPALWEVLPSGSERTFEGLCTLVQQGIGDGYLKVELEAEPSNFLEFCLRDWLPEVLPDRPVAEHLPLLARVWNLAEGLLREPGWVNGYVMSRILEFRGDRGPETVLVEILRPLLEPSPSARWTAPYRVTLISLRQADDEFLPGEMQLAAPTILVVSDRRRPVRLGIHLRREGRSVVVGRMGRHGTFPEEPADASVDWEGGIARIGEDRVSLPYLAAPFQWSMVRAGYLIASAVDSQKLWIVESAS